MIEALLDAYPNITKEDIQAALLYAADNLANVVDIYLEKKMTDQPQQTKPNDHRYYPEDKNGKKFIWIS